MQTSDPNNRKLLSAVAHGANFLTWTGVAIVIPIILLVTSEDPVVKENSKESLHLQINILLYLLILFVATFIFALIPFIGLFFSLISIPLIFLVGIAGLILPIFAIVYLVNNPDKPYRYPFVLRFF